jgi:hypothetical protein
MAQTVSCRSFIAEDQFHHGPVLVEFLIDKLALGQVFLIDKLALGRVSDRHIGTGTSVSDRQIGTGTSVSDRQIGTGTSVSRSSSVVLRLCHSAACHLSVTDAVLR